MICLKCGKTSGDDWSQCGGSCPVEGSPHWDGGVMLAAHRYRKDHPVIAGVYTMRLSDMAAQLKSAAEWERQHHADLVRAGWDWHPESRHYSNPAQPGVTVEIG